MWMFFFSFLLTSLMASMTSGDGSSPFLQQVRIFENVKIGKRILLSITIIYDFDILLRYFLCFLS